ncbi:hypothetical protein K2173_009047 [Erythroxylum novogranatense]|uniref:BHLH domain-containing protein n=1 Tax=Erythroxylum novogranatense TaxID=1862640 RepID=A0AAV8TVP7_9ROSI|nr:hypothetical protein K2173_009047 [Erythroxylum novogranatense]
MQPTKTAGGNNSSGGGGGGVVGGAGELGRGRLTRFRSAPATWLEALLEGEDEDPLKQNQNLTQLLTSNTTAPSSRNPVVEQGMFEPPIFQRQNSSPADFLGSSGFGGGDGYFSSFGVSSSYEYVSSSMDLSPSGKRGREVELQHSSAKYSSQLKGEQSGQVPSGVSSLVDMEMEKLFEGSVPCRVRAKRGFATHPRSIAERVRRTRISDRIRKLQELVPHMNKQTNTADMLEEAADYVKFLQKQIEELTEHQRQCKCMAREQQNEGSAHQPRSSF